MQKKLLEAMPYKLPTKKRRSEKDKYIYTTALVSLREKEHLVVEIFPIKKGVTEPIGRMVMTATEYEVYITSSGMEMMVDQDHRSDLPCWTKSGMVREAYYYSWGGPFTRKYEWKIDGADIRPDAAEDAKAIKEFAQKNGFDNQNCSGINLLLAGKDHLQNERNRRKWKKRIDHIDKRQKEVRTLPKDFRAWAGKIAHPTTILFYKTESPKTATVTCSHCGKTYTVDRTKTPVRHNDKARCKECRSNGIYTSIGRKAVSQGKAEVGILQKAKDTLVYRLFTAKKVSAYNNGAAAEHVELYEKFRAFMIEDDFFDIKAGQFEIFYNHDWAFEGSESWWDANRYGLANIITGKAVLYKNKLKRTIEKTSLRNSAIDILAKQTVKFDFCAYINQYRRSQVLESMVKVGLYKLVEETVSGGKVIVNLEERSLLKALDINREQLRRLKENDWGCKELSLIRLWPGLADKEVGQAAIYHTHYLIHLTQYMTIHKLLQYLNRYNLSSRIDFYSDYIRMADRLGYNLKDPFVLFPGNMLKAHDETMMLVKEKKTEDQQNRYKEYIPEYKKRYEIIDEKSNLQIIIPGRLCEIAVEGKRLHHCVGTYIRRVADKETVIAFIRKMNDIQTPYFTMEIKDDYIVQVRGERNCDPPAEVLAIVRKLKDRIKKRVDKATRELEAAETMAAAM